jgi:multicomponent Na+:H+ antiporter subunit E
MTAPEAASWRGRSAVIRFAFYFLLWLAVSGVNPMDLPVGLAAAGAATWVCLKLLPPSGARLQLGASLAFALDFLRLSLVSGLDVARRALRPRLDLHPGFVAAPLQLRPGVARDAFLALASLLPGTLPTGFDASEPQTLLIHGLDVTQPIAEEFAAEETLFMRTMGPIGDSP